MKLYILGILTILMLIGCAAPQMVSKNTNLKGKNGIMLTNFSCGHLVKMVTFYPIGEKFSQWAGDMARAGRIDCNTTFNSFSLPEGEYYFGSFWGKVQYHIEENKALKFSVSKNSINYIGDISFDNLYAGQKMIGRTSMAQYVLAPRVKNNSDRAKVHLNETAPMLISRYEFKTNLSRVNNSLGQNSLSDNVGFLTKSNASF